MQPNKSSGKEYKYTGVATLLLANGIATWQFIIHDGSILQVLWVYWLQSVIIGIINIVRIISSPLKISNFNSSTQTGQHGTNIASISHLIKYGLAFFFASHYGFFHLVYAFFLVKFGSPIISVNGSAPGSLDLGTVSAGILLLNGLIFFIHHVISLAYERAQLKEQPGEAPDIREIMSRPYRRIIPMHIIIISGPFVSIAFNNNALFFIFITLKVLVDLLAFNKGVSHPGKLSSAHNQTI